MSIYDFKRESVIENKNLMILCCISITIFSIICTNLWASQFKVVQILAVFQFKPQQSHYNL